MTMSLRFEDTDNDVIALCETLIEEQFPDVKGCTIKIVFDLKKRTGAGMLCLGWISKGTDLLRFFSRHEAKSVGGYDYVIGLDKMAWQGIERADRVRILRHELRHIAIDYEAADPYMVCPHDVQDFKAELRINEDDPDWKERVSTIAIAGYANAKAGLHPYQGTVPGADQGAQNEGAKLYTLTPSRKAGR
jgi:hypothetical protein